METVVACFCEIKTIFYAILKKQYEYGTLRDFQ